MKYDYQKRQEPSLTELWNSRSKDEKIALIAIVFLSGTLFGLLANTPSNAVGEYDAACGEHYIQSFTMPYSGQIKNWDLIESTPTLFFKSESNNGGVLRIESDKLRLESVESVRVRFDQNIYVECVDGELSVSTYFVNEQVNE